MFLDDAVGLAIMLVTRPFSLVTPLEQFSQAVGQRVLNQVSEESMEGMF